MQMTTWTKTGYQLYAITPASACVSSSAHAHKYRTCWPSSSNGSATSPTATPSKHRPTCTHQPRSRRPPRSRRYTDPRMGRMSPTTGPHRPATPDEVVEVARRLRQRLGRHLNALEAGEVGAVDDVAAVLRTLLAHGKGDDVVARLCRIKSIPLPQIMISEPVIDRQKIGLAFGAVPAPAHGDPVRLVDINIWRALPALIVRGAPRRVSTWEQLITDYANTFGSHLSGTIPHLLSQMSSICYSGSLDLGEYLIHCAGIVAEDALQQILGTIDGDTAGAIEIPRHRRLNPLLRLIVEPQLPEPLMTTQFYIEGRPIGTTIHIAKVRLDDLYFLLELTPRTADTAEFEFEFTNGEPEWWNSSS
jgi:hypothetical protein